MKLGFDVDDVLCDFTKDFLMAYERQFGHPVQYDSIDQWGKAKSLPGFMSHPEGGFTAMAELVRNHKVYEKTSPMPDAAKALARLKHHGHHITLITASFDYPGMQNERRLWLKENGFVFDEIVFAKFKSFECRDRGLDWFVDDNLENCLKISKNSTTKAAIIKKPWNGKNELDKLHNEGTISPEQSAKHLPTIPQFRNVMEFADYILKMK